MEDTSNHIVMEDTSNLDEIIPREIRFVLSIHI